MVEDRVQPVTSANDLLFPLLRRDWDSTSWSSTICQITDWTAIVQTALNHGVAGLLCRSLRTLPNGEVPQDIVDAAGVYVTDADAQGAVVVAHLFDILDILAADGIPVLPFKGPVLGVLAHASATIRPSQDIDVLVRREDMARAIAALSRLGYHLAESLSPRVLEAYYDYNGQVILFAEGRTPVEPHWEFSHRALDERLDLTGLWNRARPVDLAGRAVLTLSLEDTLLIACVHGCKGKWSRLLWVADLAALVHRHPALDWPAVMERAESAGLRRVLLLGLALAQDLFSSPLPVAVSAAIEHDRMCRWLVQQSKTNIFGPVADLGSVNRVSCYHLRSREHFGDRVRYAWRMSTTPRLVHYRMIKLPDSLFFGYVVVKIVHDYLLLPIWNLGKGRLWRRTRVATPDAAS